MRFYERRLPHWDITGEPLFITFRLHGSLPKNRHFEPRTLTAGQAFAAMDRLLDECQSGPRHLQRAEIAATVLDALLAGDQRFSRYRLHAFVVMPNHVHLLATPLTPTEEWLGRLKSFAGLQANKELGLTGPFWQHESYDHLVRNNAEFDRIRRYIENNPVRAGLAPDAEHFRWSSAFRRQDAAGEA